MEEHNSAVAAIATQVRDFYDRKEPFRIYHGSSNSTKQRGFQRDKVIDTSRLNNIVRINRLKRTAFCEPNVAMDQLVHETMKSHMIPQAVMELPGITVGGGFAGSKHGFFGNTVSWIEIVLANGEVVTASKTERSDLFEAAAGSFGTFGVTTLLAVQLVEAKPFVRLDFHPVHSVSHSVIELEHAISDPANDYVDAILLDQDLGAVMVGRLTKDLPTDVEFVQFTRRSDPWFHTYVEEKLALDKHNSFSIAVPIVDHLFRYDRGVFWSGKHSLEYFGIPFNSITRYLFDPVLRSRGVYHAMHESGFAKRYIAQDIGFPSSTVENFVDYHAEEFGHFPLWLCPLQKGHSIPLRPRTASAEGDKALSEEMLVNVGVWAPGPRRELEFINVNRKIEKKVRELHGVKSLYARSYYTEEEFWDIYDRSWYDDLRVKYYATTLPSVYDKIRYDMSFSKAEPSSLASIWPLIHLPAFWDIWPTAALYGVLMAFLGLYLPVWKDYVLVRRHGDIDWRLPLTIAGLVFFPAICLYLFG